MSRITGTMAASALLLATVVLGAAMLAHAGTPSQPSTTERPIIGILTLPNHNKGHLGTLGTSYMAASYVKWVESGGARVVPLRYDDGPDALRQQAESLNGILFTGGGTAIQHENGTLSAVGEAGRALLGVVLDAHANGEHVPLWCTCLGFEMLHVLVSGEYGSGAGSILDGPFDSENLTLPLDVTTTKAAFDSSRIFGIGSAPDDVRFTLTHGAVTMNNHVSGIKPETFDGNNNLTSMLRVLSTNKDRKGNEFVSTVEGIDVPIYATQWHPEKVQFEWWTQEGMNHSTASVNANAYPARWLGAEARKNGRHFTNPDDETAALIYNFEPVFTGPEVGDFETEYFFKPTKQGGGLRVARRAAEL